MYCNMIWKSKLNSIIQCYDSSPVIILSAWETIPVLVYYLNTSSSPLLSISWTHWTIKEGIRGRVEGAKLSNVPYKGGKKTKILTCHLYIRKCMYTTTVWKVNTVLGWAEPWALGLHFSRHSSLHSGWLTTRQSLHFTAIFPKRILFPHGMHVSGRIT